MEFASELCMENHRTTTRKKKGTSSKRKKPSSSQHCWPGFKPTPGKAAGEKGSCEPKAGKQSPRVRRADQKAAAASKLSKQQSSKKK